MRNKSLNVVMIVLVVFLMATTATFAQRGNRAAANSCCMDIPGLTEQQKTQITTLEQQHQKDMQAMRDARRKSGSYTDRDAYQAAVNQKVTDHRNAVKNLLNADQKVIFDNIQAQGGQGKNQQANMRRGSEQKRGNSNRGRR
jgi:uncharacterized membrane protein